MEDRIQRATRILTVREIAKSGLWEPADEKGATVPEEEATHVRNKRTGKVYKWTQQKRITRHEEEVAEQENERHGDDLEELDRAIDRVYNILERLENLRLQKAG